MKGEVRTALGRSELKEEGALEDWNQFTGLNRAYVLELYERYLSEPESVDPKSRQVLATFRPPESWLEPSGAVTVARGETGEEVEGSFPHARTVLQLFVLARDLRERGHLTARVNALAPQPPAGTRGDPVRPEAYGLTEGDLSRLPATLVEGGAGFGAGTALDVVRRLRALYADGPIGYEFSHIEEPEVRQWLYEAVESGRYEVHLDPEGKRRVLERLTQVEAFETYLHRTFQGQKRFSIEGVDVLVPVLDDLAQRGITDGMRRVVVGMAHRGRLSVLAHVFGKPFRDIFREFTDHDEASAEERARTGLTGDAKYHLGWRSTVLNERQEEVELILANNPSHLEFVNPVVKGIARAGQDDRATGSVPAQEIGRAMDITVHGDAAFPGEGVVAETLNLSGLPGYTTGGTIHIIANNQIGFTTNPEEGRSTRYASDLAKGFEIPIIHVNADDPEACLTAVALAYAFRQRFHHDVLVDLVGYRRYGHNEGDEPAFTQPLLYERIRSHRTVRAVYADRLVAEGALAKDEPDVLWAKCQAVLKAAATEGDELRESPVGSGLERARTDETATEELPTRMARDRLERLGRELLAWPADFVPHERVVRVLGRRAQAFEKPRGVDWAYAEVLAFASLVEEGIPIRLAGQDSQRGTFGQRNLVLHDTRTDRTYAPIQHLSEARASFAVYNSPLSETAAMGFEYGYSIGAPDALVLWEAQYGDFANVAQVVVDQFLAAARTKWGERSGLTLLLPHGYEGQGPEHSSARLERYLQLAAKNNLTVANVTTAAQYFHLLRRQGHGLARRPRPLVLMTPKSLLRHPLAASDVNDLTEGRFQPVLGDPHADAREVTRVVLVSGKVAVEYLTAKGETGGKGTALIRLEQLYPFPTGALEEVLAGYANLREVVWLQEEPRNMGAWAFVRPHLERVMAERRADLSLRYVGPDEAACPAPGYVGLHTAEMRRILTEALGSTYPKAETGAEPVGALPATAQTAAERRR